MRSVGGQSSVTGLAENFGPSSERVPSRDQCVPDKVQYHKHCGAICQTLHPKATLSMHARLRRAMWKVLQTAGGYKVGARCSLLVFLQVFAETGSAVWCCGVHA
eukprot:8470218-Alexandrium_andersonii.AAC.1